MLKYAIKRILHMIPTLFGVLVLTFILFDVVGGSPAEIVLGKNATAESIAEYDRKNGYDRPLLFGFRAEVPFSENTFVSVSDLSVEVIFPYPLFPGKYTLATDYGETDFSVPDGWRLPGLVGIDAETATRLNLSGGNVKARLYRRFSNPFASQFFISVGRILRGDLGESTEYRMPVARVLCDGVAVSLSLTVPVLLIGTVLALIIGAFCAESRGSVFDRSALGVTTALMSVNYVIWVVAGQYLLAYKWNLFPIWGYESWMYLVLPVIIGIISGLGHDVRFYRTVILDEAGRQYVRTAISKGLSRNCVLFRHVMRNSLIPVITNVSLSIPYLFTGSILLESFFGLPGLGGVGINAVHSSDFAMLRAVVLVGAALYQISNLIADLAYAVFDPRVRIS